MPDDIVGGTEDRIRSALLGLMQDGGFGGVTVSGLCRRAGVSRGTFYNHYRRLDDVLDEVIDMALSRSTGGGYRCVRADGTYDCPYGICDLVLQRPEYVAVFFDPSLSDRVISKVSERCMDRYVRDLVGRYDLSPSEAETIFRFQLNGCLAVNRDAGGRPLERNRDLIGAFIVGGLSSFERRLDLDTRGRAVQRLRAIVITARSDPDSMEIGRYQPALIMAAALAGLVIGAALGPGDRASWLVEAFLMLMLYVLFLSVDLGKVGGSLRNVRFTASALCLNFLLAPFVAYLLGIAFFPDSTDVRIGLLMMLATPCTDWYLVFTGLTGGNVELGMSVLPLNLVLQILLLPVYLLAFMGGEAAFDAAGMLADTAAVLAVPFAAAVATRIVLRRMGRRDPMGQRGDDLQLLFLCLAVAAMFAVEGDDLLEDPVLPLMMLVPLLGFFVLMLAVSQAAGRALGFGYADRVALTFTSMARNSPLALAIAVAAFPDRPLIALALVVGALIELPVLTAASWALRRRGPDVARPGSRRWPGGCRT